MGGPAHGHCSHNTSAMSLVLKKAAYNQHYIVIIGCILNHIIGLCT